MKLFTIRAIHSIIENCPHLYHLLDSLSMKAMWLNWNFDNFDRQKIYFYFENL